MKVLMLTPSYDPIIGGTETVVKNLAINLNKIGVETDVMTFNMDKKWEPKWKWDVKKDNGFKVYKIPAFNPFTKIPNPTGFFFKINVIPNPSFREILEEYDILHFHDDVDLTFPLFSYFVKKPKVFHCHTLNDTHKNYKKNILSKTILKKVSDLYLCVSESTSNLLLDLNLPKTKVRTLYNGVDTEKFRPDREEKVDNLILFVARISKRKGLHILLKSLFYLKIPIGLKIVGPDSTSEYSDEIKEMIETVNREGIHKVTYLGFLDEDNLIKLYQKASLFICPSILDIFPTVNPQALACGTPIVGTNVGGIPEIVKDGVNGILVPPNDPVRLAEAIQQLLEDKELRTRYGENGRKIVEQCFSWEYLAKELTGSYNDAIEKFK